MFCTFFIWSNTLIVRLARLVPPRLVSPSCVPFAAVPQALCRTPTKPFRAPSSRGSRWAGSSNEDRSRMSRNPIKSMVFRVLPSWRLWFAFEPIPGNGLIRVPDKKCRNLSYSLQRKSPTFPLVRFLFCPISLQHCPVLTCFRTDRLERIRGAVVHDSCTVVRLRRQKSSAGCPHFCPTGGRRLPRPKGKAISSHRTPFFSRLIVAAPVHFVSCGLNSGAPCGTQQMSGMDFHEYLKMSHGLNTDQTRIFDRLNIRLGERARTASVFHPCFIRGPEI